MDAYRVEEITRYAAYAPRKPAKVIMELLDNRREIQAAVVHLIGERDDALREITRLRAIETAARAIVEWDDNRFIDDGVPKYWDDMDALRAALAAVPLPTPT